MTLLTWAPARQRAPQTPERHRDKKPDDGSNRQGQKAAARRQQPDNKSKRHQTDAAERSTRGIKRSGVRSPSLADEVMALFALALMFLDHCGAGEKNGRKCQKKTADFGSPSVGNDTGQHGHKPAEPKPKRVLVPITLAKRRGFDADDHRSPRDQLLRPQCYGYPQEERQG
jgi:hypothetical protein